VESAREAAEILDAVRAEGSQVRVEYEGLVRFGLLLDFRFRPFAQGRTLERLDWSMRFEWLSREEVPTLPQAPGQVGASALSNRLAILSQQLDAGVDKLVGRADGVLALLQEPVGRVRAVAGSAAQLAHAFVDRAAAAIDTAKSAVGLAAEVSAVAYEVADAARAVTVPQVAALELADATAESAVRAAKSAVGAARASIPVGGISEDAGLGVQLSLARDLRAQEKRAAELRALAFEVAEDTRAAALSAEPQVTFVRGGEDLRDVALRELGSADAWRDLAALNGIVGSEVRAGREILLPRGQRVLSA